ncbi:MAG: nucleotidyl transferase AbiEii/AbiGii toxin family protein [Fibrobacterota bacterium]
MIDQLKQFLETFAPAQRMNALREYLQWLILKSIDVRHYRKSMDFVGGTALRIIFSNGRFSEDLDFSIAQGEKVDFKKMSGDICSDLIRYGLDASVTPEKRPGAVSSCFFRFSNLLGPLGVVPHQSQKIAIKVELDHNPPSGAVSQEFFMNGPLMFSVNHYDIASLFAGKLHALFFRKYCKGRDYYDLLFYLRKKTRFNLALLRNAAAQTHPGVDLNHTGDVLRMLKETLDKMDDEKIEKDLAPFLFNPEEISFVKSRYLRMALDQNIEAGVYPEA